MSRWRRLVCQLIGHRWRPCPHTSGPMMLSLGLFEMEDCTRCDALRCVPSSSSQPTRPASSRSVIPYSALPKALYEGLRAGTAATAPPAPTDIRAASTLPPDRDSGSDIGEGDQSSFTWDGGPYGSLSLTGARVRFDSLTSTPTPFDDWRRSPRGS